MPGWGQAYFQQRVDHRIEVRLDDEAHVLRGLGSFTYTNHAPVALDTLWLHLWPNAYRDRGSALCKQLDAQNDFSLHFAKAEERGWIDSLHFSTGAHALEWGLHPAHADIAWLALPGPLRTGEAITVSTPFRVQVPDGKFSRLGHIGQAYMITQWYPKPAVYNKDGWHLLPYLSNGEFYNEFGAYDVAITVPANYVVGATGLLQDEREQAWMDSLAALPLPASASNAFPPSATGTKTLRFIQDQVHDFAWFADKRFIVRKGEAGLPSSTVTSWALFTPAHAARWDRVAISAINESVRRFSEWAGEYPYAACTAVDGTISAGGGMEYPMITVIGDMGDDMALDQVIAHEVGHNWFQGMLASNERDHPWMDEGLNSYFELRYMRERYPGASLMMGIPGLRNLLAKDADPHHFQSEALYRLNARRNLDQALNGHSTAFTELNYGAMVYAKSALVLDQLHAMVGRERMDRAMRAYFNAWKYRHPGPADLRHALERELGEDLGWAFDELVATNVKVEVKALRLREGKFTYASNALNGFAFPVSAWKDTALLGTTWIKAEHGRSTAALPWPDADRVRIDAGSRTLDIDRRNNEARRQGLLKRHRLPALKFLAGIEREDRRTIFFSPAIGYNRHDGVMAGAALYNTVFPAQRLEWAAAPLYGLESGRLAGGARVMWSHDRIRSNWLRNMHVGLSGFAASLPHAGDVEQWYQRLVPSIQFDPRLKITGPEAFLRYRNVLIQEHAAGLLRTPTQERPIDLTTRSSYHEASINLREHNGFNPFSITLTSLHSTAFHRASLDAAWSAIYDRHKHRITFRAFAGSFLRKDRSLMRPAMGWRMHWGSSDLLYDRLYTDRQPVGRNTAVQFNKDQGGFKTPTAIGTSDTWIAALNMELDFPFALPLAAFASYGAAPLTLITQEGKNTDWRGNWELGIGLRIWRDMAEVWIPLAFSQDIQREQDLRGFTFTDRIRIVLALEKMDPTQVLRKLPH